MTIAWYGHLKYRDYSLVLVILASWLIALPEYALQVPANRIGYSQFSATQLKIIQEAISITVFIVFGYLYLKELPNWRTGLAFLLILAAVALAVSSRAEQQQEGDKQVAMREENVPPPDVK
jgi:uncharacterized protein (DUF486 family)